MSRPALEQASLSAPSIASAMEQRMVSLKMNAVTFAGEYQKPSGFSKIEKRLYLIATLLSAGSAIVFWYSSDKAADRYLQYGQFFTYFLGAGLLPPLGGAVTNALFNLESYLYLGEQIAASQAAKKTILHDENGSFESRLVAGPGDATAPAKPDPDTLQQALIPVKYEKIEWMVSAGIAFFAVLPYWFASLQDDKTQIVLTTLSALLCGPVNLDGSKNLITWIKSFDPKDRLVDVVASTFFCRAGRPQRLALRKARNLVVKRLQDVVVAFKDDRVKKSWLDVCVFGVNSTWKGIFKKLLLPESLDINPRPVSCGSYLLFGLLSVASVWANYGYTIDSYNGGKQLWDNEAWGWFCAVLHMVPGFGFTLKGLINIKQRMLSGRNSLERLAMPTTYTVLSGVMILFALYSGYTGDEMNYQGCLQFISDNPWIALILGIIANIGTAIMFNGPQCLSLAQRIIEIYLMKCGLDDELRRDIIFTQEVSDIAGTLQKMPMPACDAFFNEEEMPRDVLLRFLRLEEGKGRISEGEIKSIGKYYSDNCCFVPIYGSGKDFRTEDEDEHRNEYSEVGSSNGYI